MFLLFLGLVLLLLLVPLPHGWSGSWEGYVVDFGHVPLFAVLTIGLWWTFGESLFPAALLALVLAAGMEFTQSLVGRTASWIDFLLGTLGVAAAVIGILMWRGNRSWWRLTLGVILLLSVLAWPVWRVLPWVVDAFNAYRSFPVLADFQNPRQMLRWHTNYSKIFLPDQNANPKAAAKVEFYPGSKGYPNIMLRPAIRNWGNYRKVCCSFQVKEKPIILIFSILAIGEKSDLDSRYQLEAEYSPGKHVVCINFDQAAKQSTKKQMDWKNIYFFQIFTYPTKHTRAIWIDRIWLE